MFFFIYLHYRDTYRTFISFVNANYWNIKQNNMRNFIIFSSFNRLKGTANTFKKMSNLGLETLSSVIVHWPSTKGTAWNIIQPVISYYVIIICQTRYCSSGSVGKASVHCNRWSEFKSWLGHFFILLALCLLSNYNRKYY